MSKPERKGWVGVDLGGTKMLAVVYDDAFRPIGRKRRRSKGYEGAEAGVRRMVELISDAVGDAGLDAKALAGIGVGCAGPLDLDRGVILEMPNLGWRQVPLRRELEQAFGCPVVILNDVDAGVYGEFRFGGVGKARSVVGVFAGTGIGGGAVVNGEILRGTRGSCLEVGHIPVAYDGPLCGCQRRGCLEAVAGRLAISAAVAAATYRGETKQLVRTLGSDLANIRSRVLADAIAAGDAVVEDIVRHAARSIGWAMAGVVNVLAPDVVLLGGGMVEDMPALFREEIGAAMRAQVMPSYADTFRITVAKLAGDATVMGAAAWAERTSKGKIPPVA
jgi:glucokinase